MSNQSPESPPSQEESLALEDSDSDEQEDSMAEYYQLQRTLFSITLILSGIIFVPVCYYYSLNTALNYFLGAAVGLVYLRTLAKDVERLGQQGQRLGGKGLGIFAILMIVAIEWRQLNILPVFLGFLTYKAAIVLYALQITLLPAKEKEDNT